MVDGADDDPDDPDDPDPLPDPPAADDADGADVVAGLTSALEDPSLRVTATPPTMSAATTAPATPPRMAARFVLRPLGAGDGCGGMGGGNGSDGPDDPIWMVGLLRGGLLRRRLAGRGVASG